MEVFSQLHAEVALSPVPIR